MKYFFNSLALFLVLAVSANAGIPAGYYHFAKNKSKTELKTALKNVSTPLQVFDYGSGPGFTWQGFYTTDRRSDSTVIDMYSNIIRKQTSYAAVSGMHIEHSLPKSWWGGHENMAYKDLFHLYPADGITNSTKNNLPLGEVTGTPTLDNSVSKVGKNGFGTIYTDNCFEPANEFKGDFARSYMYISSIYEDFNTLWQSPMMNNNRYPVWKPWAIDLLLKWHRQDPVSTKELTRNEAIYQIQGNRNPFIDFPALAEYIWGADTTQIFSFPTETEAYLTSPRRGTNIDFGTIMTNVQRTKSIHLEGVNFAGNISVSIKNSTASLQISGSTFTSSEVTNGFDLNLTFAPITEGAVRDTLVIAGGGLTENRLIPIKANVSPDFVLLEPNHITPIGGTLQWISDPAATDYRLKVVDIEQKAGDLIIASYVEGSSWNKAIEIYNRTGKTIDLSKYALRKQSNGDGAFGTVLKLSGQLEDAKTYSIVHKSATNSTLTQKANLLTDTLLQINGNDAICLTRSGMIIDMVGEANAGADVIWGLDVSLKRKNGITHPQSVYNKNEWTSYPIDYVDFIGAHSMAFLLADPFYQFTKLVGNVTTYEISDLQPNTKYTYSVETIKPGGNTEAYNTIQLHTSALSAPIIMNADQVKSTEFTANWEEDLYATSYLVDVFSTSGQAETTETEGFELVGVSGTPLPTGWSGTATGNYTTTTSSGVATPSVSLKNNGEYLQTKLYDAPVTKLSFMYRFASTGTGSSLLLEGSQNGAWQQIATYPYANTSKVFPQFNFTTAQNYRQFRFTYSKSSGNMAIDDIQATYGKSDSTFIVKNAEVNTNKLTVLNLQPNTTYFYRVKSKLESNTSVFSEVMEQKTLFQTGVKSLEADKPTIKIQNSSLIISNLNQPTTINIIDTNGKCIRNYHLGNDNDLTISIDKKGIYILRIYSKNGIFTKKIVLF